MFAHNRNLAVNPYGQAAACGILVVTLAASLGAGSDDPAAMVHVQIHPAHDRQTIDGFGGSLAYWGYDARRREHSGFSELSRV